MRVIPKNVKKIEKHDFSALLELHRSVRIVLNYLPVVYSQRSFKVSKHGCGGPFYDSVSTVIWAFSLDLSDLASFCKDATATVN